MVLAYEVERLMGCLTFLVHALLLGLVIVASSATVGYAIADSAGATPSTGLLCISNCATCPVICAPPPSPLLSPSIDFSPPPVYHSPPKSPPPPPPSTTTYTYASPPPPHPPPPSNTANVPSIHSPPTMDSRGGYSYPYYYFYASAGWRVSPALSVFILILCSLGLTILKN